MGTQKYFRRRNGQKMDWPGLLKWSLKNQDGTKPTEQNLMMTDDDKKWLSEALQEYTFDEVKEMQKILDHMVNKNVEDPDYETWMLEALESLHDLTYSLDNNKNLAIIGGIDFLFDTLLMSKNPKIVSKCALILAECVQNNSWMNNYCLKLHPLRIMNIILSSDSLPT